MIEGKLRFPKALAAVFLLVLTWAGAPAILPADPVIIRLWDIHVHDKKFRKSIFAEFNKANPEIKVEYTSQIAGTYDTALEAASRSDSLPEIFVPSGAASMSRMVEMGWIRPLEEVAPTREALDGFKRMFPEDQAPFVENVNMFKGKTYSWPIRAGEGNAYIMLYYNTKLFRDAGPKAADGAAAAPETWDDMRLDAKKTTGLEPGKTYGVIFGGKDPTNSWKWNLFYSLALAGGWSIYGWGFDFKTGLYDYHHPGFRGAIQLWLDMKKDGSVFPGVGSMDDEQSKFRFAQGVVGMTFEGPWAPGGFLSLAPSWNPMPSWPRHRSGAREKGCSRSGGSPITASTWSRAKRRIWRRSGESSRS